MTNHRPSPTSTFTLTGLVGGIAADASRLMAAHAKLFRTEIGERAVEARNASIFTIAGAGLVGIGGALGIVALVFLLQYLVPAMPPWASWAIVGALSVVLGAVLILVGLRKWRGVHEESLRSIHAIQETWSWITNPRN